MLFGCFDNSGTVYWRFALSFQLVPAIIFIILALTCFRDIDAPMLLLLADRDVDETLRRLSTAVRATAPEQLAAFDAAIGAEIAGPLAVDVFSADRDAVSASVELVKKRATVRALVAGMKDTLPELYDALVGSRDEYMAASLLGRLTDLTGPQRVVAVVGMAHEDGIARALAADGFRHKRAPPVGCA